MCPAHNQVAAKPTGNGGLHWAWLPGNDRVWLCQVGPTKDLTLDDKLRALDALHDRQFAEKGAKQQDSGLEVATFRRR